MNSAILSRLRVPLPIIASAFLLSVGSARAQDLWADGHSILDLRYRAEWVDQQGISQEALASTMRARFGYQLGRVDGFSGLVSIQGNVVLGPMRYDNTAEHLSDYPVVADPQDIEVDEAYASYDGVDWLHAEVGRQVVKLDNDRFVGNVGFRQLEQTFDALRADLQPAPHLSVDYIFAARVNRIFGAHHPDALHAAQELGAHLLNARWTTPYGSLVGYGYLIGNRSLPATSHADIGASWRGSIGLGDSLALLYSLEAARQSAVLSGTMKGTPIYLAGKRDSALRQLGGSLGYESLGGDGTSAFQTPLATLHAFNGWADRFLSNPASGLTCNCVPHG